MNILITGANRGLGYCLTRAAVEQGHRVAAAVRSTNSAMKQLEELSDRYPGAVRIIELNVADEDSVSGAALEVERTFGCIDSIVNNAAILVGREDKIEEVDFEELRLSFEINLFGAMRVVKHFLQLIRKRRGPGSIVNISSEAGSFSNAYGGDYPYALTKAALNMFSQQLSKYLAQEDVAVYSVHPGWMRTDMGGNKAPLNPNDSARAILELIDRRKEAGKGKYVFVDFTGKDMLT